MTVYLDTSALVKLYIPETDSAKVGKLVETADMSATSCVAYAEARAAFACKRRERLISLRDYRTLVQDFENDWDGFFIVDVSDAVLKRAGRLAETFALRGYDAFILPPPRLSASRGTNR